MSTESDEMIIETEGVKVNFGDFWALKGVDIQVRKGELIVILGRSGCGGAGSPATPFRRVGGPAGRAGLAGAPVRHRSRGWAGALA